MLLHYDCYEFLAYIGRPSAIEEKWAICCICRSNRPKARLWCISLTLASEWQNRKPNPVEDLPFG